MALDTTKKCDIQHNDTLNKDTQHICQVSMMLSAIFYILMLSGIMLVVIIVDVIKLKVIMPCATISE